MSEIEEIKSRVCAALSERRFIHTMGVAEEAKRLAEKWGADTNSAFVAGLVHDYAKEVPIPQTSQMLEDFGFHINNDLKHCPALLHGPLAAYLAEKEFGITDNDILNAITYHTTGRPDMSALEKIIYLADFIEPNRSFEGVETVRRLAYESLDSAVLCEANMIIVFNIEKNVFLHSDTVKMRNQLFITKSKLSPAETLNDRALSLIEKKVNK